MPQQIRVVFHEPPEFTPSANIWVNYHEADEGITLELQHDYPDFQPAVGWVAVRRGQRWRVLAVDGRRLSVEAVPTNEYMQGGE